MILVFLIRVYQRCLSPLLPPTCRFYPSCSDYCIAAVQRHGAWRGGWIGLKRLLRCHPGTPGGYDPIPRGENGLTSG